MSNYNTINIEPGLYTFICVENLQHPKALTTRKWKKHDENKYFICEEIDRNNPKESQLFYVYKDDDGYYVIISYESNECIGLDTVDIESETPIVQLPINFTSNVKWEFVELGDMENEMKTNQNVVQIKSKNNHHKIGNYDFSFIGNDEKPKDIPNDVMVMQLDDIFIQTFKLEKYIPKPKETLLKEWSNMLINLKKILTIVEYKIPEKYKKYYKERNGIVSKCK